MITHDEVVYAYRYILGREPENSEAISSHLNHKNIEELRRAFIHSDEFARILTPTLPVGRFREFQSQEVQIECSPAQLEEMLAETKKTWSQFGEDVPHWSVLVDRRFTPENIEENIEQFYQSGFTDIEFALNTVRRAGIRVNKFDKAIDFGCGVGRLSLPLSKYCKSLTSIDVSPGHLKLAKERATLSKRKNIDFVQLKQLEQLDGFKDYDFILSLIVLQHNPPPLMVYAYSRLLRALKSGGVAVIQVPTFIPKRFSVAEYLANPTGEMEMHAVPQKVIYDIIAKEGCRPIDVSEDGWIGTMGLSHTFTVIKG